MSMINLLPYPLGGIIGGLPFAWVPFFGSDIAINKVNEIEALLVSSIHKIKN